MIIVIAASVIFLTLLQRIWPYELRREHNDLIGWQVTVLGTTYAVIVGFMLYAVWTAFQVANGNVEAEANCLLNMARAAEGLPADKREQIQNLASQYANVMLTQEWPAMSEERFAPMSHRLVQQMWATVMKTETRSAWEQTSFDHTLTELSDMTEHRRQRQLEVISAMPGVLWAVLIVGAAVTIISACLFGSGDFRLHSVQVTMLSLIIGLALVAIADINRPFQGSVHVNPTAFERARSALADLSRTSR